MAEHTNPTEATTLAACQWTYACMSSVCNSFRRPCDHSRELTSALQRM